MSRRLKFTVVVSSSLLTLMLVIGALMGKSKEGEGAYRPLSVYTEVLAHIKSEYVEEPDMNKVTRGALHGLVEWLDPLSSYLTAEQYAEFQKARTNPDHGSGLATGLVVHKRYGYSYVLSVLPGSPADQEGIRAGDLLEAIEELSTRALPPAAIHTMLSGKPGTSAKILIRPAQQTDEPREIILRRADVKLPDVTYKLLEDNIGYIDADILDADRVKQIADAVRELGSRGAARFILDLRGNALGDHAEGVGLADLFLKSGQIAQLKGQQYPEKTYEASGAGTLTDKPLVIITDRSTAGAAEVAVSAILDNKRGEVVGDRTYGLAAVQETIPMDDGAALILSIAKFYRASGKALQDGGIEPSEAVAASDVRRYRDQLNPELNSPESPDAPPPAVSVDDDPYLKKAIEVIKKSGPATAARNSGVASGLAAAA